MLNKTIKIRTDCASYVPEGAKRECCKILTELVCRRKICTFYKNRQEEAAKSQSIEKSEENEE